MKFQANICKIVVHECVKHGRQTEFHPPTKNELLHPLSILWGSMECGSSISKDGYGQDRDRIMAILAQDANTD